MPEYEYENRKTGERLTIFESMKNAPPFAITVTTFDGVPLQFATGPGMRDRGYEWKPATDDEDRHEMVWHRVLNQAPPIVREHGVNYGASKLPVSRFLPPRTDKGEIVTRNGQKVQKYADGGYADMQGRRIIDSKKAADLASKQTGMVRD